MNKKYFLAAPAIALGICSLATSGGVSAVSVTKVSSDDSLRNCIKSNVDAICELQKDIEISKHTNDTPVSYGKNIIVKLNGKKLTTSTAFSITHGSLTFDGEGSVVSSSLNELFKITGSTDSKNKDYSKLVINKGVTASTGGNTVVSVKADSGYGSGKYGLSVEINGALKSKETAIRISGDDEKIDQNIIPTVAINKDAKVEATGNNGFAIESRAYAKVLISEAELLGNSAVKLKDGIFEITNSKLTATGNAGSVIVIEEDGADTKNASITIDGGVYTSNKGYFLTDKNKSSSSTTVGTIEIKNGTFVASDLFNVDSHFTQKHSGFIAGGTWGNWDDENDAKFVAGGYLRDLDKETTKDHTIMTVVPVGIYGLPDNYRIEMSRSVADADKLAEIVKNAGINDGHALIQSLDIKLFNNTTPKTELPDGKAVTLVIKNVVFPEQAENTLRSYYVINVHDGQPSIINAAYDVENRELTISNVSKFSQFVIAYQDTSNVVPTKDDSAIATEAPDTGAGMLGKFGGAVASTLGLFMIAGSAIATYAGVKFYRNKR